MTRFYKITSSEKISARLIAETLAQGTDYKLFEVFMQHGEGTLPGLWVCTPDSELDEMDDWDSPLRLAQGSLYFAVKRVTSGGQSLEGISEAIQAGDDSLISGHIFYVQDTGFEETFHSNLYENCQSLDERLGEYNL